MHFFHRFFFASSFVTISCTSCVLTSSALSSNTGKFDILTAEEQSLITPLDKSWQQKTEQMSNFLYIVWDSNLFWNVWLSVQMYFRAFISRVRSYPLHLHGYILAFAWMIFHPCICVDASILSFALKSQAAGVGYRRERVSRLCKAKGMRRNWNEIKGKSPQ